MYHTKFPHRKVLNAEYDNAGPHSSKKVEKVALQSLQVIGLQSKCVQSKTELMKIIISTIIIAKIRVGLAIYSVSS